MNNSKTNKLIRKPILIERWKQEKGHHYKNPCLKFSQISMDYEILQYGKRLKLTSINECSYSKKSPRAKN
jgi:hypothetical protein